ncbi:hypothetical protein [Oxynema aestuarii]|uniref:Uncharacterized protein n=1 Tax=Oxynema aestuarii AP17 TaxID=2064643 RepID=A0A6H1TW21_9CYAN|nr:hypothetical protein [Oxynema aestuarii]QIZ70347.1 hypothetical protein HCG48_06945 [Oxynema aestuarii AP17]
MGIPNISFARTPSARLGDRLKNGWHGQKCGEERVRGWMRTGATDTTPTSSSRPPKHLYCRSQTVGSLP